MTRATSLLAGLALGVLSVSVAGCDNGPIPTTTPVAPVLPSTPITETFSSQIVVGGSAVRSFTTQLTGTATVQLVSAGPPSNVALGFGVGIQDSTGVGCALTKNVEGPAGATLTVSVDVSTYCVKVYDPGTLAATTTFSVKIVRP